MKLNLTKLEKDFIYLHLIFTVLCIVVLIIPVSNSIGIKLLILVVIYNILIPVLNKIRNHTDMINLWFFAFLVSLFQIWPDWFLSAQLDVLVFPEDGLFKIGTVSGYMLGLWMIPIFIIVFTGIRINDRSSDKVAILAVSLLSLLIFGLAEQSMWMLQSWYPQNVTLLFGHLAVYIVVPEILLGLSSYYCYTKIREKHIWTKIGTAFLVMILYLGNACFFYFLIEKVIII